MEYECTDCAGSVSYYNPDENDALLDDAHQLFHQPCQRCDLSRHKGARLCATCQHLHLEHLVHCVPLDRRRRFLFHLRPSQMKRQTSPACALCCLVQHMVSVAFGENAIADSMPDDWSMSLFLGSELDRFCVTTADIYLQFKVGDEGMSNMWIGDLHIAAEGSHAVPMPSVGAIVNWQRMRNAIDQCTKHHSRCSNNSDANLPFGFRLIDVARRSIVEKRDVSFIALSYVWGKDTRASLLTATQSTIDGFKEEGGLAASNMPKTIEDAMQACVKVGIQYLWADRLCIIQDDAEDKMHQIMAMNNIYESALLVLVSAHGDSMDFGIHGVSRPRPSIQLHENIQGLRLTNLVREEAVSSLALWQTRGWTYQEAVCARRLLHFTNTRAYYECQTSTCYEDMYNATAEVDEFSAYGLHLDHEASKFESFARHLANYTSRKLSFPSDVYSAFIGIANLLYEPDYNRSFIYGLPRTDFDRALRWYTWDGAKPTSRIDTSELTCPSWSWASAMVQGEQVRYQDTEFYGALAAWITGIQDSERPHATADQGWQTYMTLAKQEGCTLPSSNHELLPGMKKMTLQEADHRHSLSKDHSDVDSCNMTYRDQRHSLKIEPGHIVGVAQIASFRLGQRGSSHYGVAIVNATNTVAGELCGEITHFREEALASINRDVQYEFVALSLSGLHVRPYTGEERETKSYRDENGTLLDTLPIVNVLLLERKGKVVHRKELGWIYLKDWARADRHWETIMLG